MSEKNPFSRLQSDLETAFAAGVDKQVNLIKASASKGFRVLGSGDVPKSFDIWDHLTIGKL